MPAQRNRAVVLVVKMGTVSYTHLADMGHALILRQGLQFAVAVGHANGTDVVALREEQLEDHAAVLLEPLRVGAHLHALKDGGHAGGQQLVAALDLDQAKTACAHVAQALQMAERGNVDCLLYTSRCV